MQPRNPMPNYFPFSCRLSRGGGLCALIPATSDWKTSVDQLLLDHLPSANLPVLVNRCLPASVDGYVGQNLVHLLQLLGFEEPRGHGLDLESVEEVGHGGRR